MKRIGVENKRFSMLYSLIYRQFRKSEKGQINNKCVVNNKPVNPCMIKKYICFQNSRVILCGSLHLPDRSHKYCPIILCLYHQERNLKLLMTLMQWHSNRSAICAILNMFTSKKKAQSLSRLLCLRKIRFSTWRLDVLTQDTNTSLHCSLWMITMDELLKVNSVNCTSKMKGLVHFS